MYAAFKHTHMLFVLISMLSFIIRSIWAFQGSEMLTKKIVRIAPHIIDTLLLLSAIGLVVTIGLNPFTTSWILAKLVGLIIYIALGVFTLKKAKNNQQRAIFFSLALIDLTYIIGVAISKNALFFLS